MNKGVVQIRTALREAGLDWNNVVSLQDTIASLQKSKEQVKVKFNREKRDFDMPGGYAITLLDRLLTVLFWVHGAVHDTEGANAACHYRLVVSAEKPQQKPPNKSRFDKYLTECYLPPYRGEHHIQRSVKWVPQLRLLCMNPACAFKPIADSARSVVVASGTLSPMESFQSELGVEFPVELSTDHVVPEQNV